VNITRIESRPVSSNSSKFDFFVDFHGEVGDLNVNALLDTLKSMTGRLLVLDEKEVRVEFSLLNFFVCNDLIVHNLLFIPGTLVSPSYFGTRSNSQPHA